LVAPGFIYAESRLPYCLLFALLSLVNPAQVADGKVGENGKLRYTNARLGFNCMLSGFL